MKKLLLLFFVVIFSGMQAQSNVAGHDFVEMPVSVVSINSKSYFLERKGADCCGDEIRLYGINEAGQTTFSLGFQVNLSATYKKNYPVKLLKTMDNALLLVAYGQPLMCGGDLMNFTIVSELMKIDTNGVMQFTTPILGMQYNSFMNDVMQYSDSSYYAVFSDGTVCHVSKTGHLSSTYNWGFTGLASLTGLSNGHLLLNGTMTSSKNVEITTSGSIIAQQSAPTAYKLMQGGSGAIYALTVQHEIQKYNSSLGLTATGSFTSSGVELNDFVLRNDSVFAVGSYTGSVMPFYTVLNASLNPLYQHQSQYQQINPRGVAISNKNQITMVGTGTGTNYYNTLYFRSLYQFPVTGSLTSVSDIGVQSIAVTSSTYVPGVYLLPSFPLAPAHSLFDADVTVANLGTDTIHSFTLNHLTAMGICSTFQQSYNQIILPGGTVVVHVASVTGDTIYAPANTPDNTMLHAQECFFTTVPNASNDRNISNNRACAQVNVITSIKTNPLMDASIQLFPNPMSDALMLRSSLPVDKLEVYNLLGVLNYSSHINAQQALIETGNLPAGVYFVKLETERGTITRKVIKE